MPEFDLNDYVASLIVPVNYQTGLARSSMAYSAVQLNSRLTTLACLFERAGSEPSAVDQERLQSALGELPGFIVGTESLGDVVARAVGSVAELADVTGRALLTVANGRQERLQAQLGVLTDLRDRVVDLDPKATLFPMIDAGKVPEVINAKGNHAVDLSRPLEGLTKAGATIAKMDQYVRAAERIFKDPNARTNRRQFATDMLNVAHSALAEFNISRQGSKTDLGDQFQGQDVTLVKLGRPMYAGGYFTYHEYNGDAGLRYEVGYVYGRDDPSGDWPRYSVLSVQRALEAAMTHLENRLANVDKFTALVKLNSSLGRKAKGVRLPSNEANIPTIQTATSLLTDALATIIFILDEFDTNTTASIGRVVQSALQNQQEAPDAE